MHSWHSFATNQKLLPKTGRLLPRIRRFLLITWRAASKELWLCIHLSFRKTVQLRLQIFRSLFRLSEFAFRSSVFTFVAESRHQFWKTHTVNDTQVSFYTHHRSFKCMVVDGVEQRFWFVCFRSYIILIVPKYMTGWSEGQLQHASRKGIPKTHSSNARHCEFLLGIYTWHLSLVWVYTLPITILEPLYLLVKSYVLCDSWNGSWKGINTHTLIKLIRMFCTALHGTILPLLHIMDQWLCWMNYTY